MHKLQRGDTPPPCLKRFQHGRDSWEDLTVEERTQINAALIAMQGQRCAYCECPLDDGSPSHIEHFRQRARYPAQTFEWTNLFRSCQRSRRCGSGKDSVTPPADMHVVIKPDDDDPLLYLRFRRGGEVEPLAGLSSRDTARAAETIRAFSLNDKALLAQRKPWIESALQTIEMDGDLSLDDCLMLYKELSLDLVGKPFEGVIVGVLRSVLGVGQPSAAPAG